MKSNNVTTYFVLDFDRTLLDTGRVVARFEDFLMGAYPRLAVSLRNDREQVEKSGGSYDVVAALALQADVPVDEILRQFVASCASAEYFLPGAEELLGRLKSMATRYGVMTYGGVQWQQTKLQLVGIVDEASMIIPSRGKGVRIADWRSVSGLYRIPDELGGGEVDRVVLVDDKAVEFEQLPVDGNAQGYLLRSEACPLLHSQKGEVGENVTVVHSLRAVMEHEF
jgi:hypothetical protein